MTAGTRDARVRLLGTRFACPPTSASGLLEVDFRFRATAASVGNMAASRLPPAALTLKQVPLFSQPRGPRVPALAGPRGPDRVGVDRGCGAREGSSARSLARRGLSPSFCVVF